MSDKATASLIARLATLIQRRSGRGRWAYLVLALIYVPAAIMFAGDVVYPGGPSAARLWPLLFPVAILVVQWVRPTIIGWAVIFLPTFFYFCAGVYYAITNNLGPHPQWEYDSEGVILGSIFLAALLAVCIALTFAARPRAFHETRITEQGGRA